MIKCNGLGPPLVDIILFGLSLSGFPSRFFKTRLLGSGFHTIIKGVSFSSPIDEGSHNPPPFRAQGPRWHSFLSPIDVGPPSNPPPSGPNVPSGTPPCVYPLRGTTSSLAHRPVSNFDIICNSSGPLLADIVLFGFSLKVF